MLLAESELRSRLHNIMLGVYVADNLFQQETSCLNSINYMLETNIQPVALFGVVYNFTPEQFSVKDDDIDRDFRDIVLLRLKYPVTDYKGKRHAKVRKRFLEALESHIRTYDDKGGSKVQRLLTALRIVRKNS